MKCALVCIYERDGRGGVVGDAAESDALTSVGVVKRLCCLSNHRDCAVIFVYFFGIWRWHGAPPVWGPADGLHGRQPAELVGSTSDTPPCDADVISQPLHYRRCSLLPLCPRCMNGLCTKKQKSSVLRTRLVTARRFFSFALIVSTACHCS